MPPNHVPILPALLPPPALPAPPTAASTSTSGPPANGAPSSSSSALPPRRSAVLAACEACRLKKVKCDGRRPKCSRCERRSSRGRCQYRANEGETRAVALKRRGKTVEDELAQMHELYDSIHKRSEVDAWVIFKRMRLSKDPLLVLQSVKDADLVLPGPSVFASTTDLNDPTIRELEEDALRNCPIHVPARPWTAVAGDGIVSELVYGFFVWEAYLFSCFHPTAILADMRSMNTETSQYCSAFLVNAMCSYRAFLSARTRSIGLILRCSMGQRFMDEAKKLFELEGGRPSLPTVLGLYVLFFTSAMLGKDRAGLKYRHMAQQMLKQLRLDRRFDGLDETHPEQALERDVISRSLWGLFSTESIVSFVNLQPSLLAPPTVPRLFQSITATQSQSEKFDNVDILGVKFDPLGLHSPPLVPGSLDAQCRLSEMLNDIREYNQRTVARDEVGSPDDLGQRRAGYGRLMTWKESLPPALRVENTTPQTCCILLFISEVAYEIIRPLPNNTRFGDRGTVTDLLIHHCKNDVEVSENYAKYWPPELLSFFSNGIYKTIITLASLLHEPRSRDLFVRACCLERTAARSFSIVRFIMRGTHALVLSLGQQIHPDANWCFENLGFDGDDVHDVRVSSPLPLQAEMRNFLLAQGEGHEVVEDTEIGARMGALITRWNGMSMSP